MKRGAWIASSILIILAISSCFAAVAYGAISAPSLPFLKLSLYSIDKVIRPVDAGEVQPYDFIVEFDGQPFFPCMYLWRPTPIYDAPRDTLIPITLGRHNPQTGEFETFQTEIILRHPSVEEIAARLSIGLVAASYLVVGAFILLSGVFRVDRLLAGVGMMLASLVIIGGPDVSDFEAPFSVVYWVGFPLWGLFAIIAHAKWPIDQLEDRAPRILIILYSLLAATTCGLSVAGSVACGCFPNDLSMLVWSWSYLSVGLAILGILVFFIARAHRLAVSSAQSPLIRSQIRAVLASVIIGLGSVIVLSMIPVSLGIRWVAPPEVMLLVSVVIPVTYAFVMSTGRSAIRIERFLGRIVYPALLLVAWAVLMFTGVNALFYWQDDPHPLVVGIFAATPVMAFGTFLRGPFGRLVDVVLYGRSYDYEAIISKLIRLMSNVADIEMIARGLVLDLPQALLIEQVCLWVRDSSTSAFLLAKAAGVPADALPEQLELQPAWLDHEERGVVVLDQVMDLGGVGWHVVGLLRGPEQIEGILLLGSKSASWFAYGDKDVRVIASLAGWVGANLASYRLLKQQTVQEREQIMVLDRHEEAVRRQVAGELHDSGITALVYIRKLIQAGQTQGVIDAAVARVVDDLRELSSRHLIPAGLELGLGQALQALQKELEHVNRSVTLDISPAEGALSQLRGIVGRELFYIIREAIANADKHAPGSPVKVSVYHQDRHLYFAISDGGPGFNVNSHDINRQHLRGIGIMNARALRIQSRLDIDSDASGGTTVTVRVPYSVLEGGYGEDNHVSDLG